MILTSSDRTGTPPWHREGGALCACLVLFLFTSLALGAAGAEDSPAPAQQERSTPLVETIVVTATRTPDEAFELPQSITVLDRKALRERNVLSVVDALDESIGIWVEKRTTTNSDPVIRGLSGSNLLALVDGNTLSTFWGEGGFAGDDMYGKIDAEMVRRVEVVRGPASVQYGSNALGGVLNFLTQAPPIDYYPEKGFRFGGRVKGAYGSAAQELRGRTELFGAANRLKWIAGFSIRDVDDVRGGRGVGVQVPTSGEDLNFDGKLQVRTTRSSELTFSFQNVHRSKIHRFYRPNQDNENFRRGYSLSYAIQEPTPFWEEAKINLYYQYKEDRRRFFDTGAEGRAKWRTFTGDAQMTSYIGSTHRLIYGVSFHRDKGESPDDEQFTIAEPDGTVTKAAPDTVWDNVGLFVMHRWYPWDGPLSVTSGFRYDRFRLEANPDALYQPPGGRPELDDFVDNQDAFTGGVGLLYPLTDALHLFTNYSRGFRQFAPSFGVRQLAYGVIVPSQLLDPVTADNIELGVKWLSPAVRGSAVAYYTDFDNFQNVVRGTYSGQDWFDYNGNSVRDPDEDVYVTAGNGDAYVYGFEIEADLQLESILPSIFGPQWSIGGGFMWNYGQDLTNDIPLRHTHPMRGIARVRWDDANPERGLWWEFTADMVGRFDRVPPSRLASDPSYREDPQDASSGQYRGYGLPGYTVLNLRGGVNFTRYAAVTLALENLTDKKYRAAHSRWDAPGINFLVSLDIRTD